MPTSGIVRKLRAAVGHALLQLPSVSALTFDGDGRLLLIHNTDDGRWAVPGGCVEPNESPEEAVKREMREETGLDVEPGRLVGVFGGPGFRVRYPNGDETSYVTAAFDCVVTGGTLRPDGEEAQDVRFVTWDEIDRSSSLRSPLSCSTLSGSGWREPPSRVRRAAVGGLPAYQEVATEIHADAVLALHWARQREDPMGVG
jgi:ADP-ribose pyrophosphatase YjhB (NUDIX family)